MSGQLPQDMTVIQVVISRKDRKRLEAVAKKQRERRDRNISAAGRLLLVQALDVFFMSNCSENRTLFDIENNVHPGND